eukprot:1701000-Rhodomonas_salina.1
MSDPYPTATSVQLQKVANKDEDLFALYYAAGPPLPPCLAALLPFMATVVVFMDHAFMEAVTCAEAVLTSSERVPALASARLPWPCSGPPPFPAPRVLTACLVLTL